MTKKLVGVNPRRGRASVPLLKSEIIEAQLHTNSNRQAAKWLSASQNRYNRYAKIYDLYDRHLNPLGLGTSKGFARRPNSITLQDVFANKYPKYSMIRLKYRMLVRNMLKEECGKCGFNEKRLLDNKTPLMLTFKDTIRDFTKSNLWLLCYNCTFLTTGAPWCAHKNSVKNSLTNPDFKPFPGDVLRYSDTIDAQEVLLREEENKLLAGMDAESFKDEILRDLGR